MPNISAALDSKLASLPRKLALEWPGGSTGQSAADVRLKLRNRHGLAWLARGQVGQVADAYVRGDIDIEGSLRDVMALASALVGDPVKRGKDPLWRQWIGAWRSRWLHSLQRDADQVRSHYDLCDAFFELWLDPLRVYSCAYYAADGMNLAQAQQAKLDLVCRKLQLRGGQRFLDIGAGWGGLLLWAAEHYGVQALGITLSRHQHAYVSRLIEAKGLGGRVEVRLLDYRDLPAQGAFDRIASIGMFEHVGRAQMDRYFGTLRGLLREGGMVLNHAIAAGGLDNRQLGGGMGDFIEKHIFPGGELVHVTEAAQGMARSGLELLDVENLRPHYARTLWAWSEALEASLDRARAITSDASVRAYRLYLAGSAMCFERGWLSLYQMLAARPDGRIDTGPIRGAQSDYPFRRGHMLAPGTCRNPPVS
jgi:cyclopropane-fatty-acyl-phospholipid synthase